MSQLWLNTAMPTLMLHLHTRATPLDPRRIDMERTSFGYSFAQVGAELAKQWKFPPAFSEAIANFPDPLSHTPFDGVSGVIHLAAWRARAEHNGLDGEELAATVPTEVCLKLGLTADTLLVDMPPLSELCEGMEALLG